MQVVNRSPGVVGDWMKIKADTPPLKEQVHGLTYRSISGDTNSFHGKRCVVCALAGSLRPLLKRDNPATMIQLLISSNFHDSYVHIRVYTLPCFTAVFLDRIQLLNN